MTPSELAKVRDALRSCIDDTTEVLAILDREAGRKTRTVCILEALLSGQWVCIERTPDRERVEKYRKYRANFGEPTRILEVTESWEDPQS